MALRYVDIATKQLLLLQLLRPRWQIRALNAMAMTFCSSVRQSSVKFVSHSLGVAHCGKRGLIARTPIQLLLLLTSSSAVAERPRDALCPSVVSLNKIITCADSFILVT